jgi:hypothetical protein
MLPWLFAVLLLLNAAFFYWGYQRETAREPVPPPLPEGVEEIRLLSEVRTPGQDTAAPVASGVDGSPAAGQVERGAESAPAKIWESGSGEAVVDGSGPTGLAREEAPAAASGNRLTEEPQGPTGRGEEGSSAHPGIDADGTDSPPQAAAVEPDVPAEPAASDLPTQPPDVTGAPANLPAETAAPAAAPAANDPSANVAPEDADAPAVEEPTQDIPPRPDETERESPAVEPSETDLLPRDPFLNDPDMDQMPATTG